MKKIAILCIAIAFGCAISNFLTEIEVFSTAIIVDTESENMLEKTNPILFPATCFAPDTDPAVVEAFYQNREAIWNSLALADEQPFQEFNLGNRWNTTAIDGGGLGQGDLTTLTWSYVADGTSIGNGGCGVLGESGNSNFIAFFNGIYGGPTTPGDYTTAPWHTVFVSMFNSWSSVSGVLFVYEPNDDGTTVVTGGPGVLGIRGDIRISGHTLDGNSGVLACNYFPQNGDMIIDTSDNFFVNNPGVGTTNVLTHEIGHGLGIQHVCPVEQTKLMEPFITTAFNGPQEDDILATNRHYGDVDGDNTTPAAAVLFGTNTIPTSYSRMQRSIDDNSEIDYFSFTINSAAMLSAALDPTGTTYLEGVQNGNGSCTAGTPFNTSIISDLMFEVLSTNGTTVLATANANGPGNSENVNNISLPVAGTYFLRVSQQGTPIDNVQMYDISVNLTSGVPNNPPTAICANFTAQLDAGGNATITAANVDGGSNDAEGPVSLSVNPSNFNCSNIGNNTVTLTVTDNTGQTDTCTATVSIEDNMLPTAMCQNFTAQLDASGNATINAANIDNGSTDNCGLSSLVVSPNVFTCADVGANTVTLIVTDVAGNVASCTATVTVEDAILPAVACQNFTAQLDASGNVTINAANIDNGSTDNCGIGSLAVSPSVFTCADVGANTVTLTVTDVAGNIASCTATVTVEDATPPTAICQNISIQLDASGNATIAATAVDNGSADSCGVTSLSVSPNAFTCADIGDNTATLTVTDTNGNVATCTAIITVEDNILPTATCQDFTTQLDASGNATITSSNVDNGSTDNCVLASVIVSPNTFTCADVGTNTVTLTVTDLDGNVASCTATVTIEDTLIPTAICQNITVLLDATGNATITGADISNGSLDNCIAVSLVASPNTFTCAEVGLNTVILTVTDAGGNQDTCTATVLIIDNVLPTAICQNITVEVDASCTVTIDPTAINNGSTDNCGIASIAVSPDTFTCSNVGDNTVTLTITDVNDNVSTCTAIVTVNQILGVGDVTYNLSNIGIYPNPAKEVIHIVNSQSLTLSQMIIHDILGRVVATYNLKNLTNNNSFNVSNLQSGNYIVIIKNDGGQIVKRFIKQ